MMFKTIFLCFFLLGLNLLCLAEPGEGDIFKEFIWSSDNIQLVFGPDAVNPEAPENPKVVSVPIILDLENAIKAEVVVEFWSGHPGTSRKSIRFNDNKWVELPLPRNTLTTPEAYFSIINQSAVEIPLSNLQQGENEINFTCGPQIVYNFDYPAFSVHNVIVRVYYSQEKAHTDAHIVSPVSGSAIEDYPVFEVKVTGQPHEIRNVDFIAEYEGFSWGGDGVFRKWHYNYNHSRLEHHIGTATSAPWKVTWDTKWIPDQRKPMRLIARVTDKNGITTMTPVVNDLTFHRKRSVVFYPASGVKQFFNSQYGKKSVCSINWLQNKQKAKGARLIVATHGPQVNAGEIGINGYKLGLVEAQPKGQGRKVYHEVDVPLDWLEDGENEFSIYSDTNNHALECLWPGPSLLLEFVP